MADSLKAAIIETPMGRLRLSADDRALRAITWTNQTADATPATDLLAAAAGQLAAYFARQRETFDLPLDPHGSALEIRLWDALREIPYGTTRSYGELARDLDMAAQTVGRACGSNPLAIVIPCHRVLGADGSMVGYSGGAGIETKARLLALEGVGLDLFS